MLFLDKGVFSQGLRHTVRMWYTNFHTPENYGGICNLMSLERSPLVKATINLFWEPQAQCEKPRKFFAYWDVKTEPQDCGNELDTNFYVQGGYLQACFDSVRRGMFICLQNIGGVHKTREWIESVVNPQMSCLQIRLNVCFVHWIYCVRNLHEAIHD